MTATLIYGSSFEELDDRRSKALGNGVEVADIVFVLVGAEVDAEAAELDTLFGSPIYFKDCYTPMPGGGPTSFIPIDTMHELEEMVKSEEEDKYLDMLEEAAAFFGWEVSPAIDEEGNLHGVIMGDEGAMPGGMQEADWEVKEQLMAGRLVGLSVERVDGEQCHANFYPY